MTASCSVLAGMVVIGSSDAAPLTESALIDAYLSRGSRLTAVDQPKGVPLRRVFYKTLLGWNESALSHYWSAQVFAGMASPPTTVSSDQAAIAWVSSHQNALAYINEASLLPDASVAVVYRFNGAAVLLKPSVKKAIPKKQAANTASATHALSGLWPTIISRFSFTENNPAIASQRQWLLAHKGSIEAAIDRASPYLYTVYQAINNAKLPTELALIPLIESGYNPNAYSQEKAVGIWQFQPNTADGLGLEMGAWFDGRKDVADASMAASAYLEQLHASFHDWLLALAAYDAGEGVVSRAILANKRADKPTDFWSLSLPAETEIYVPRLLALAEILRDSVSNQLTLPAIAYAPLVMPYPVSRSYSFAQLAALSHLSVATIARFNPGLLRQKTPPNRTGFIVWIPSKAMKHFKSAMGKTGRNDSKKVDLALISDVRRQLSLGA